MIALFFAVALAAPKQADVLEAEWRSLQLLRADPERYRIVREPFTISDGPLKLTISEGVLVPIFSGHLTNDRKALRKLDLEYSERGTKEFVGFAFTAAVAEAEVTWQERADNLIFANHMVRNLGHAKEDFQGVADGEAWTNGVTEGLVLSIDPAVRKAFIGPDDETGDPFEIIVYGDKPRPGSRARAVQILQSRVETMKEAGLPPGRQIASDRVAAARGIGPITGQHMIIDLHGTTNLGSVAAESTGQPKRLDWMTLVRDDTGVLDSRLQSRLTTFDVSPGGEVLVQPITGVPFPPLDSDDPFSPPAAPVRMEAYDAYANIVVFPRGADVEVQIMARLKLRAVGGPIQWFDLHIPRAGLEKDFKLESVLRYPDEQDLLSETPLIRSDPVLANKGPDGDDDEGDSEPDDKVDKARKAPPKRLQDDPYLDRPESTITIALPEPLQAGEDVVLDVSWSDAWPMTHLAFVTPTPTVEITVNLGEGSGRQDFLPRLAGAPTGNPSRFRARVAVPTRSKLSAAISGARISARQEGDWNVLEAGNKDLAVPFADVAIARFAVHDESARGFPTIRTRLLDKNMGAQFAQEARRLIKFYEGYLPKYPWPEHEVFQGPGQINGWVWVASHEMTNVMKTRAIGVQAGAALARGKHTASRIFAHEMAHQWWGHMVRPAHRVDFWIAETFAEEFACMYLAAAFNLCEDSMDRKRKAWEVRNEMHIPRASLTDAYSSRHQPDIVYRYGPYVFHRMLQSRMGHKPYHAALDLLVVDNPHAPVTTERLLHYFDLATEDDLTDFFDFWVYGGFVPEDVVLSHVFIDGVLTLEVTGDVPFGTFDVAVVVDGDWIWVDVVDGFGARTVELDATPESIELDPTFRTLIKKRKTL